MKSKIKVHTYGSKEYKKAYDEVTKYNKSIIKKYFKPLPIKTCPMSVKGNTCSCMPDNGCANCPY